MAQAKHIGKVVISKGGSGTFTADASYLITGGMGALGLKVAEWFVARGARNLVLAGRQSPSEPTRRVLAELEAAGARVLTIKADVASREDVAVMLEKIRKDLPRLRGIVHAAGVLDDGVIKNQRLSRFEQVLAPKVAGSWNLHQATRNLPLDFFIGFSSIASLIGSAGQANYAAANAFLDALAQFRHGEGLPGLSICWGSWADNGMSAGLDRHRTMGLELIRPESGLRALANLMHPDIALVGAFPMNWATFLKTSPLGRAPLFGALCSANEGEPESAVITARLQALEPGERREHLLAFLRDQVAAVLSMNPEQVGTRERLFDLGIDSLMALELKNRLEALFGRRLPQTFVFDYPMVEAIADDLVDQLPFEAPGPADARGSAERADDLSTGMHDLSETEAEVMLLQELEKLNF